MRFDRIRNNVDEYCIPPKSDTAEPCECNFYHYKERHIVGLFRPKQ